MNDAIITKYISEARFSKYDSIEEYKENIQLSMNFYIPLSVIEISLRNAINSQFSIFYGQNWLLNEAQFLQADALTKIAHAKDKLTKRNETITHSKLTAELTFGFWTSLFQKPYDKTMRLQTLRGIFSNLPRKEGKPIDRKVMSSKLDHIRKFRNRIFHFEKIINKEEYKNINEEIDEILIFLHKDIFEFSKGIRSE